MNISKSFKLSSKGRVASAISIALTLPMLPTVAMADGITAIGQTSVTQNGDVDVINIANPNAKGLSHNQYRDFNVSQSGAVLNNSLNSGKSVLTGTTLSANDNLTNGAASVILNEVISKNPSLIHGQQEVFGIAADYVLANPNGITCEDCGFINTNRASLVVGTPSISDDKLSGFEVGKRNRLLTVVGDVDGDERLDLLAPQVDINGNITASNEMNVLSGRYEASYDDLEVAELSGYQPLKVMDGSVIGSMQSGRIRLHNNDNNGTQLIQADLTADSIEASADNLDIIGSTIEGQTVSLNGNDKLSIGGKVLSNENETEQQSGVIVKSTKTDYTQSEEYLGSHIDAETIDLSGSDVQISGSELSGTTITATGKNISIDGVTTTDVTRTNDRKSKGLWFNENESTTQVDNYHQSSLTASNSIDINATDDLNINGASITSEGQGGGGQWVYNPIEGNWEFITSDSSGGSITLTAGDDLSIAADITTTVNSNINRYKNETSKLKSGAHTVAETTQTAHKATIKGGDVVLSSGGNQELHGVDIDATSATLDSSGDLTVANSNTVSEQVDENVYTYWGGLAGGETHINNASQKSSVGSSVEADTVTFVSAKDINVVASNVAGSNRTAIMADENVNITNGFSTETDYQEDWTSKALNIPIEKVTVERDAATVEVSNVSGADLSIAGDSVSLTASNLSASNTIELVADSTLKTDIANSSDITTTKRTNPAETISDSGIEWLKEGDLLNRVQYNAESSTKVKTVTTEQGIGTAVGSKFDADSVDMNAQSVELRGSDIHASSSIAVNADNVILDAGETLTAVDTTKTAATGPEAYIRGGLTNLGVGFGIGTDHTVNGHEEYKATNNTLVADNVLISSATDLVNKGTQVNAGTINLTAGSINNEASYDRIVDKDIVGGGSGSINISTGVGNALSGMVEVAGTGTGTTTEDSTANVTSLDADQSIVIIAENQARDAGTQMKAQSITIQAEDYVGESDYNSVVATTHSGKGQLVGGASTAVFADVEWIAGGQANYQYRQEGEATAVKGNLQADQVSVIANNTASVAHNVQATDYNVTATDSAQIAQDSDKKWTTLGGFNLGAGHGYTAVPNYNNNPKKAHVKRAEAIHGNAGFNVLVVKDDKASVANVNADNVSVTAENSAQIVGANIAADSLAVDAQHSAILVAEDTYSAGGMSIGGETLVSLDDIRHVFEDNLLNLGGAFNVINEKSNTAHGATIDAGVVTINSNATDSALKVEGADISADTLTLNSEGSVDIVAGESKSAVGNFSLSGSMPLLDDDSGDNAGDTYVSLETDASRYYTLGDIDADQFTINSGSDVALQSNIDAAQFDITAQGDVNVSSAQDKITKVDMNLALPLKNSPLTVDFNVIDPADFAELVSITEFQETLTEGENYDAFDAGALFETANHELPQSVADGSFVDYNATGHTGLDVDSQRITQHATINADNLNANVATDNITVNAATLTADNSELNGAQVTTSDNNDFVHTFKTAVDLEALDVTDVIANLISGEDLNEFIEIESEWDDTDGENTKAHVSF